MSRAVILNVVGLTARHIDEHATPHIWQFLKRKQIAPVEPILPAVTCTMQSTFLTGRPPSDHGVVGNGWYHREMAEHHFWKQSNHLVYGEKIWETMRREFPDYTCAKIFWWFNMYSSANYSVTPRPIYCADGNKVFDVHTYPMEMRDDIKKDLGDFPFPQFWLAAAGIESTEWIAAAAKWVEEKSFPNLSLVYLPHLDYSMQKLGPKDPSIKEELKKVDAVVGDLIDFYKERAVKVTLLSEYGITEVKRPIHLNRIFREKGWLSIKDELGTDTLDLGSSKAFAIADHQVAHVYINDASVASEVNAVVESTEGVGEVLSGVWKNASGLDHYRSGDIIAVADADSWFTYYFWEDDERAPDYARTVDIHRKPGYDPVELFLDPDIKHPQRVIAKKLMKKKMGMRILMDVVPLDAALVKGSHGRIPEDRYDWPILAGDFPHFEAEGKIPATQVYTELLKMLMSGVAE